MPHQPEHNRTVVCCFSSSVLYRAVINSGFFPQIVHSQLVRRAKSFWWFTDRKITYEPMPVRSRMAAAVKESELGYSARYCACKVYIVGSQTMHPQAR